MRLRQLQLVLKAGALLTPLTRVFGMVVIEPRFTNADDTSVTQKSFDPLERRAGGFRMLTCGGPDIGFSSCQLKHFLNMVGVHSNAEHGVYACSTSIRQPRSRIVQVVEVTVGIDQQG
jgi:hypothetical protein